MSSLAWISTSEACPARPPTLGWCRRMRVLGSAFLLPLAPAARRNAPIEPGRHAAARRVDVQVYVLLGVLALQVQKLRHDGVGHLVVHRRPQKDDAVLQEARVDVHRPLAARALLNNVGDHCLWIVVAHYRSSLSSFSVAPASTFAATDASPDSASPAPGASSGIGAATAFSTRKSRAFAREISSSRSAYVPFLRKVSVISSGSRSESSARCSIWCITSSSSASILSAEATASSVSSFLIVSAASGRTRSLTSSADVPASW